VTLGAIYGAGAQLSLGGTGTTLHDTLVVSTLYLTGNAGAFQLADGATSAYESATDNQLFDPVLTVAVQDDTGAGLDPNAVVDLTASMAYLNQALAQFGVNLSWATAGTTADVHVHFAGTTPEGGAADGVLGFTTATSDVYFAAGWNLYTGSNPVGIGSGQFDFQTLATHELAHTLGLGESGDPNSVMYEYLAPGTARRTLTDSNLSLINTDADRFMKAGGSAASTGRPAIGRGPAGVAGPVALPAVLPVAGVDLALPAGPPVSGAIYLAGTGAGVLLGGEGMDILHGACVQDVLIGGFGGDQRTGIARSHTPDSSKDPMALGPDGLLGGRGSTDIGIPTRVGQLDGPSAG